MSIGENIKKIRNKNGISQADLAEKLGISQPMLCMIERGTKTVSLPLSKEIAEILGCNIEDLLDESA